MKIPGPDHPITITANPKRVRALFEGHEIADSGAALTLQEANYPPVQYFPRADVAMDFLGRTPRSTHCPYKGDAAYFTIARDGVVAENKVWTYEEPYEAVAAIRGCGQVGQFLQSSGRRGLRQEHYVEPLGIDAGLVHEGVAPNRLLQFVAASGDNRDGKAELLRDLFFDLF